MGGGGKGSGGVNEWMRCTRGRRGEEAREAPREASQEGGVVRGEETGWTAWVGESVHDIWGRASSGLVGVKEQRVAVLVVPKCEDEHLRWPSFLRLFF